MHECIVVQPLRQAWGTTLVRGTNEAIVSRETSINRSLLDQVSRVLATSPGLGSLVPSTWQDYVVFSTSLPLLPRALKLGFVTSQREMYKTSNC